MKKKRIIILATLIIILFLSTFMYYKGDRYKTIRLKFYNELTGKPVLEERQILISQGRNLEEAIVEEIFLGPMSVFNKHFVPYGIKPSTYILRDKTAYLDLPLEPFKNNLEALDLIKDSLLLNSKKINNVIITIDGQIPGNYYIIDSN